MPADGGGRAPLFTRLGRAIVRHPWYPVIFWILLVAVSLPLLMRVNSAVSQNATQLPSSYPSQVAQAEMNALFPNRSSGSSEIVLLQGPNVTAPTGRNATLAIAAAIESDASIQAVTGVTSIYSEYQGYLAGQATLSLNVLGPALGGAVPLPAAINRTAAVLWGPAAYFVTTWQGLVAGNSGSPPSSENWAAYQMTHSAYAGSSPALANLTAFYFGAAGANNGFNGSADCASQPATVVACSDHVSRFVHSDDIGAPGSTGVPTVPQIVLATLGVENSTAWPSLRVAAVEYLGATSTLPPGTLLTVWTAFPSGSAAPSSAGTWAAGIVRNGTIWTYPVPVPAALRTGYVDRAGNVTILVVAFSVGDQSATAFADVPRIGDDLSRALLQTDPSRSLTTLQTGDVAASVNESNVISQDVAIALPVTFLILVLIVLGYFRAPLAPVLSLAPIGIALLLGLAGVSVIGATITKVHSTSLTLLITFVLGVGTDYSVFLMARYREELTRGRSSPDAVVAAVTWAGESIATSGATIVLAMVVLVFSGTSLLSQWGLVLSVALAIAVVLSLTLVPALLVLFGPRTFWPYTRERFQRRAARVLERHRSESTYFHRAGRLAARRPIPMLAILLLISLPALYLALNVPLGYDYFGQLPTTQPASRGLHVLAADFGPGFSFPLNVLVTFRSPLVVGGATNATEWTGASAITRILSGGPGVVSVSSPVGPGGAPLGDWLNYSSLPATAQAQLQALLPSYLGSDGRTLWFTVVFASSGLSNTAVAGLNAVESQVSQYTAAHPAVASIAYGGAPSNIRDLQAQLAASALRLEVAVVLGMMAILLVVLGSAILPPLAVATIGLSVGWAWASTYLVFTGIFHLPLFFYVPVIVFIVIMGLGMDYNIFLLTRVREERARGGTATDAAIRAVASTGGIITAAAVVLAGAFFVLDTAQTIFIRAIGFAVALSVLFDAMVIRTYLMPTLLRLLGDRVWWAPKLFHGIRPSPVPSAPAAASPEPPPAHSP